ncbi:MAG: dTDP-4-dehydrorhamnose reductase [Gammaproteobacteria bacterium]|nr:dTDP-4-dehydrorhamnose reductase [Gammaproteobacteria bacterium]
MRILVFGKTGQVGMGLSRQLQGLGKIFVMGRQDADLCDLSAIETVIKEHRPDLIINAAAYTAVDKAESDVTTAELVNAKAPGVMAEMAETTGAVLIHYSTDYVFSGQAHQPYREDTPAQPLNVYGETKLCGERAVQEAASRYLILRTSWVYSSDGRNFLNTMLRLAREQKALRVVDDQYGSPTYAGYLSEATAELVRRFVDSGSLAPEHTGVYHMSCSGITSWYGFAKEILKQTQFNEVRVVPISTSEYPTPARRPVYSVLDNSRLAETFGIRLRSWQDGLSQCLTDAQLGP